MKISDRDRERMISWCQQIAFDDIKKLYPELPSRLRVVIDMIRNKIYVKMPHTNFTCNVCMPFSKNIDFMELHYLHSRMVYAVVAAQLYMEEE